MTKESGAAISARMSDDGLREAMRSENGRAFLWSLLEMAGTFGKCAVPQSPPMTFLNEGRREFGLDIFERIVALDSEAFVSMQREAFERAKLDERKRERRRTTEYGPGADALAGGGDDDASDGE